MEYITAQGWHFRLRLHADTCVRLAGEYVRLTGEEDWRELRELAPEEGERRYLHGVELTKDKQHGPVNLALRHERGEDDPWLIATDQKAGYPALRTYSRQRRNFCDWIGPLFADFEDGGFHLSRSRLYQIGAGPDRLSRLVLALSWVHTWPGACWRMGRQTGFASQGGPHRST